MPDSKYWLCDGTCGVSIGHIHYGQNVVLALGQELTPAMKVADELLVEVKRTLRLFEAVSPDLPTLPQLRALIGRAEGVAYDTFNARYVLDPKDEAAALEQFRELEG